MWRAVSSPSELVVAWTVRPVSIAYVASTSETSLPVSAAGGDGAGAGVCALSCACSAAFSAASALFCARSPSMPPTAAESSAMSSISLAFSPRSPASSASAVEAAFSAAAAACLCSRSGSVSRTASSAACLALRRCSSEHGCAGAEADGARGERAVSGRRWARAARRRGQARKVGSAVGRRRAPRREPCPPVLLRCRRARWRRRPRGARRGRAAAGRRAP